MRKIVFVNGAVHWIDLDCGSEVESGLFEAKA